MKPLFYLLLVFSSLQIQAQTTEFFDDFESGNTNWVLTGTWGLTTTQSNSPSNSLTDSPTGNYAADLDITATMANGVDLSSALDAEVNFNAIYDIEGGNFDYCYLEASGDGGITWVNIATFLGESNLTPWVAYNYSLGGFVGNTDVRLRFRFTSDGGVEFDGIYIDDFEIVSSDMDNSPPLIIHQEPVFYESQLGDIDLFADLIDISGISSATVSFVVDNGVEQTILGTNTTGDSYQFTIPAQMPGAQVDYYIEATDASSNNNAIATDTFSYIAGRHIFYDNAEVSFVNSFGPDAASGLMGNAVKFTIDGTVDVVYALIRNYTDVNRPNDDFEFHIWADNNGLPGADLITPFMVTPEANLVITSPMTRIDLSPYMAELSDISGTIFIGYTVPAGETWLTQTTPAIAGLTYTFDGTSWAQNTGDDYHFRIVTSEDKVSDECTEAIDISQLFGAEIGNVQTSQIFDNSNATTTTNEPSTGYECFGEPDGSGTNPSLDNTLWFTFVGDGSTYTIITSDCGGGLNNPIEEGDTQMAIYAGDCSTLATVDCNEDYVSTTLDTYAGGLDFTTVAGTTYYIMIDGYLGLVGEYCLSVTKLNVILCPQIALGNTTGSNSFCFGENIDINLEGTTVVPNEGSFSGFTWAINESDISNSTNPFNEGGFVSNFAISPNAFNPFLTNDGSFLEPGSYYLTPVVFAAAENTDGTLPGVDFSNGCLITGQSIMVELHGDYDPILLNGNVTGVSDTGENDGSITAIATGGSGNYTYLWSNNETTQTIDGLAEGNYSVTLTDASNCVDPMMADFMLGVVATNDLSLNSRLQLFPNPTHSSTTISYNFQEAQNLQVQLTNSIGQVIEEVFLENITQGQHRFDLGQWPEGVYTLTFIAGQKQATKRLTLIK